MDYRMVKNRFKFSVSTFLVAIMAVSLLGIVPSNAASPTTNACVNLKSGAVRILLKGSCKAKVEQKVVINTAPAAVPTLPSMWLSPRDLLASRQGVADSSNIADASSVSSLVLTDNFFHAEALDLAQEKEKVVFKAVPKGWSKATSLTVRVYWLLTENTTAPVSFEVYLNSRGDGDNFGDQNWGTGARAVETDALVVSKGSKIMNTHSFTWRNDGQIKDGELLTLSLYRQGNLQIPSVYSGKVYVMGVSVEANY
jgi:hypothetical protein